MPAAVNSKDIEEMINNLKSGITLWEDLITKSSKFSNSIKGMTMACSDFLDSMHTVCDIASKSSYGLRNTGISLTKLVLREKKMELKVCNISNVLSENLVGELDKYVTDWKRSNVAMKKEREHEWRRANTEYQKSLAEVERTEKKLRKKNAGKVGLSETANLQMDYANQDALNKRRYVEELERCVLRRAAVEERQRFKQFLSLLKPIIDCQLSLREDLDNLEEVVSKLYGEKAENLDMLPEELEQNIQEHVIDSGSRSSIPRSYSTLSKQQNVASNGSRTSLNSNSMSTTSSEWNNNNNMLMNACMEVSSRLNENMSNISHDSGIKSDKSFMAPYEVNTSQEFEWNKTLTQVASPKNDNNLVRNNDSESDETSTEDENDASTDHNSQDGVIDNNNELFPLPKRQSNEEPLFELPPDFPDALPPPPPAPSSNTQNIVTTSTPAQSHYSQSFISQGDNLYPNQSIPPPVYSNWQSLKINAAKKYGVNTLQRPSFKDRAQLDQVFSEYSKPNDESSPQFMSGSDKDRPSLTAYVRSSVEREPFSVSPPAFYCDNKEETTTTFGNYPEQDNAPNIQNIVPQKTDMIIKSSMIRRSSFATEMQVPQTPKVTNTIRRPSVQEKTPMNMYGNKNRGRSMSVTRESNYEPEEHETTPEDFNAIRQRIVSRINNEMKPPPQVLPKPEEKKKQSPNPIYMSYDYSHNLSSPVAIRSNRFFGERTNKQTIPSSTSSQMKFQQLRGSGSQHQDLESAAGERPASNDFDMSNTDLQPMTVSRKEDRFKQQLMQVLNATNPKDGSRAAQPESIQQPPSMSSFYTTYSTSTTSRNNPTHNKPKGKSSIPNPKYHY